MADHKITDFVDQSAIDALRRLRDEMRKVKDDYIQTASELAKGIKVSVDGLDQLEKLTAQVTALQNKAADATQRHSAAIGEQGRIVANTTNTISRQLMEQERVNQTTRQAYTEQERVKKLLDHFHDTYEGQLQSLVRVDAELKANARAQKENERALAMGIITSAQFSASQAELVARHRALTQEKRTLTQIMTAEEKAAQSQEGSYAQLSQQLELLKKAHKELDEQGRASDFGKELERSIQELDAHLKDLAADMGEFQRNVGNYAIGGSVKKDLKELVLEIANLTLQYQSLSEEEQRSAEGQALASHIQSLIQRAGALKDAITDTNQAITNAASDTRGFDQLGGTIQLAIDGFGLATGAAKMLGITTEDLAELQTKLQAAIAASNAMQSIQNTLQAQSAVMQGVAIVQTKLRAAAENMHTAAKGKGVIATYALTAAQWAFNAAANANPIGLLVAAIVAAIAAVWGLVKAFQAFFGPSDAALKQYKAQAKALDELCEANDRLINRMKARGATEAELLKQSLANKQAEKDAADALFRRAEKLYDKDADEYKDALEAKKRADEEFEGKKEDSLNYLLGVINEAEREERKQTLGTHEYKRQLIQAELEQQRAIAATLLQQGKITRQVYKDLCASLDKAAELKTATVNADERKSRASGEDPRKAIKELREAVRAGEDALLHLIKDSAARQRQEELLAYRRRIEDLNEAHAKRRKGFAKDKAALAKIEQAHNRELEGLAAEHAAKLAEIDALRAERANNAEAELTASRLAIAEKGSEEELQLRLQALATQRKAEYIAVEKAEREGAVTAEQGAEMRANISYKYAQLEIREREDFASESVKALQDRFAAEAAIEDNAFNERLANLNSQYAEELKAAGDNQKLREEAARRHDEAVSRLTEGYAQERAKAAIDSIKSVLGTENLSAEERQRLEDELAKAKIEYEKAVTDAVIAENQRQVDSDKAAYEKRMASARQWLKVASDGLNALNGLASALYDAKIERIEGEQEANTEAGEAEKERVAALVESNVITQEEGEARKRAAEAQTAKKNEELEKKKQQMKQRQAVWDKANSIAQAGIATALAITEALPNLVLAAIAGAMGAVQIATIIATPVPKYAKGTKDHPGGLAVVGDGGKREVVAYAGAMYLTPDTPTLVDMPKGAEVYPDAAALMSGSVPLSDMPGTAAEATRVVVQNDFTELKREIAALGHLIKQQTRQQRDIANRASYEHMQSLLGL